MYIISVTENQSVSKSPSDNDKSVTAAADADELNFDDVPIIFGDDIISISSNASMVAMADGRDGSDMDYEREGNFHEIKPSTVSSSFIHGF